MKRYRRSVVGVGAHGTGWRSPAVAVAVMALIAPLGTVATAHAATAAEGDGFQAESHNPVPAECPWMDITKTPEERARLLLAGSTLEQKMRWLVEQPAASPFRTTWPGDVVYPVQVPCTPTIRFANGAQGLDAPGATAFPVAIAEAATWDPEISFAKGAAVAEESFRAGRNVLLGPGLAAGRTPLSGRTSEYYGEDPVLTGVLGAASTRGLEEGNPQMPVVANLKHYVANEQELDRATSSSNMDERTFREIYNLSYEIAIAEGDPGSIMCSYNQINGVYACENDLLQEVLKDELGFDGFVMSDFGSVHSTAPSLDAGLDMELNRPIFFTPERLHAALDADEITVEQIDQAAFRVVRAFIEVGIFDHLLPAEPSTTLTTPEHRALAQRMAEEGSVLLKNADAILPLADPLTVAVIGPTASNTPNAEGISAVSVCSSFLPFGGGRPSVPCPDPVAPLDAISARVAAYGGTVVFDDGSDPAAAAAVAASADVALVFGYYRMGEFSDIADLDLDGNGDALIAAVAAANPDTVAVLGAGSAVVMPWLEDVKAVLHTWYPGREMGTAISNLLWGDVNPSGKLPMTFPRSLGDIPTSTPEQYPGVFEDGSTTRPGPDAIRQVDYSEGLQVGYRWYQAQGIDPLFEFGHGLSYTTYEYSGLRVTPQTVGGQTSLHLDFRLANTGELAGEEVVQVYLDLPAAAEEPAKRLVAWTRVHLDAGEEQDVRITLTAEEIATRHLLEYWDEDRSAWTTPQGTFTVHVGASSEVLPLQATFGPRAEAERVVRALYQDVLGRAPEPAGLDAWTTALLATGDPQVVTRGIVRSRERLAALITREYQGALRRAPEPGGVEAWTRYLESGAGVADLQVGVYASPESLQTLGGGDTRAWVGAMYAALLGRPAAPAEQDLWAQVARTHGRGAAVAGIAKSPEAGLNRLAGYYQTFLGRSVDPSGAATWLPFMSGAGDFLVPGFIGGSAEYWARAQTRFP